MDKKKRIILIILALLILCVGTTLAYIIAQLQDSATGNASVTSDTVDLLKFEISKDITLNPTQFNVVEGGSDLSDSAVGSAILRANSTNDNATYNYYVYFQINSNNYIYTTDYEKPEIILTITGPTGSPITSVDGLTYVESLGGFDITTKSGLFKIAELYEIVSNSSTQDTIQDWTFTVTFINLDTNQAENGGKTLEAEIILSKEPRYTLANYIIENVYVEDGVNNLYYHDGNVETNLGSCTYQGNEVYDAFSGEVSFLESNCKNIFKLVLNDNSTIYYDENIKLYLFPQKLGLSYNINNVIFQEVKWDNNLNKCVTIDTNDEVYTIESDLAVEQVCSGTATWYSGQQTLIEYVGLGEFVSTEKLILEDANDKSYRYSGMYPDNYVCFGSSEDNCLNEYLYRIIGIFDEDNDGIYNIKLIKADYVTNNILGTNGRDYLGNNYNKYYPNLYGGNLDISLIPSYSWNNDTSVNENGSNNWATSELNLINLNTNFLNYFKNEWSSLIDNTTWFLGGISYNYTLKEIFDAERNNSGYNNNPTRYNAKIGLMYTSDYLYSIEPYYWQFSPEVISFTGWLQMGIDEWLLSINQDYNNYLFSLMYNGGLMVIPASGINETNIYNTARPVFYLNSNVVYSSGDGSINSPYRIEI